MMNDGGWFGMGGMGLWWAVPILILVVVMVAWMFSGRRSGSGR